MGRQEFDQSAQERPVGSTESPMRVYPMGFLPSVKQRLIEGIDTRIGQYEGLTEIGASLQQAIEALEADGVNVAGFVEHVRELDQFVQDGQKATRQEKDYITHVLRTDEELAVIFARISRNPGSFDEISEQVTEEGAAQFHEKWVVSVEGYGHASVAEHAIIHMAVENIPSLDGDDLTDNRLAGLTEFSARFKGRQGVGYSTPESVRGNARLEARWHEVHNHLFEAHDDLMRKGMAYISGEEGKRKHPTRVVREKTVADQFKNLMPASRLTSIAVTVNAREAENMIRKFLSSPYASVRRFGQVFKEQSLQVAPTLVKYADANRYLVATREGVSHLVEGNRLEGEYPVASEGEAEQLVDLVSYDPDAQEKFIAAAIYQHQSTGTFRQILSELRGMSTDQKRHMVSVLLGERGEWDVPTRALEMPGDYVVEYPGMTYGDWREYKRHRIQSYFVKPLDVRWGYMVPPLAAEMDESEDPQFHGSVDTIHTVMEEVENLFNEVSRVDPNDARYVVTRLHYRPAVAKFNAREMFHLLRLRTGPTAHPFIRRLMWPLYDQIKAVHPILVDHVKLKLDKQGATTRGVIWSS